MFISVCSKEKETNPEIRLGNQTLAIIVFDKREIVITNFIVIQVDLEIPLLLIRIFVVDRRSTSHSEQ